MTFFLANKYFPWTCVIKIFLCICIGRSQSKSRKKTKSNNIFFSLKISKFKNKIKLISKEIDNNENILIVTNKNFPYTGHFPVIKYKLNYIVILTLTQITSNHAKTCKNIHWQFFLKNTFNIKVWLIVGRK